MEVECPECDEDSTNNALELQTIQKCQQLEMMECIIETQVQPCENFLEQYEDILQAVEDVMKTR